VYSTQAFSIAPGATTHSPGAPIETVCPIKWGRCSHDDARVEDLEKGVYSPPEISAISSASGRQRPRTFLSREHVTTAVRLTVPAYYQRASTASTSQPENCRATGISRIITDRTVLRRMPTFGQKHRETDSGVPHLWLRHVDLGRLGTRRRA